MKPKSKQPSGPPDTTFRRMCMVLLVIACVFLIMHTIFGNDGLVALQNRQKEYKELQKQLQDLRRENDDLEVQNRKLQSDPKAIERLAREQLRLARPGEIIYTLPEQAASVGKNIKPDSK
jgi:cell division protein FtsL